MIALISPAKKMHGKPVIVPTKERCSKPRFGEQTRYIVALMLKYSAAELEEIFKVSHPIARELKCRFADFVDEIESPIAALDSYDGVVYKHLKGECRLSEPQLSYLQAHLRISSLLYGVLRPLDLIKQYRMEGFIRLAGDDVRLDVYWRKIQTQTLIDDVNEAGGVLIYLASKEEQNSFNWRDVKRSVRVVDIKFLQHKGDKLRQVVVYTKMARGEMVRYMADNNISEPEELKAFEWSGYRYDDELSTEDTWVWLMQ